MHKSIELGRAVLSTSTINFELWLKTSIKISPQQPCTNFEQHNAISLLNLLSSGEAWVGRGNGLYIDLDLTLRGQPLADEQVQQLSQAILDAPVWSQLCLHSSIPHCTMREPGKLRITVNHSSDHTVSSVKQRHRILPNVSAADVRPPEGVPVFFLDSVLLSIDVFEIVQQKKATTAKRLKTLTNINSLLQPAKSQGSEDIEREGWGALSLDVEDTIPLPASSPTTKRSRSSASSPTRTASFAGRASWNCPFIASTSDLQKRTPNSRSNISIAGLQTLVDGALRLSVMGSINSKLVPGIKVKTSRFGPGLAEIAPALWKSGYLLSLSQRASLLQVIGRSLCHPATTGKTASRSLRGKLLALTAPSLSLRAADQATDREFVSTSDKTSPTSSIAPLLWLHLQKHIFCKPAMPLQSFVASEPPTTTPSQSDDILEQLWQDSRQGHRLRLSAAGSDGSGAFGIGRTLNNDQANTACGGTSSERVVLGALAATRIVPEIADDELLLGNTYPEPLSSFTRCGDEVL